MTNEWQQSVIPRGRWRGIHQLSIVSMDPRQRHSGMTAITLLLLSFCILTSGSLLATPPPLPEFPALHFTPPKPARVVLDSGLVIYLLEDHELPLIKLQMYYP